MTMRTMSRLLVLPVIAFAVLLLLFASHVEAGAGPGRVGEVRVYTGDTLWDIAAELTPPEDDIRATVYEIKQLNGLGSAHIEPGMVLLVPLEP